MRERRTFKAKILGKEFGGDVASIVTFGEDDSPEPIDLTNPFICLRFAEEQVRERNRLSSIEDFEVTMTTLGSDPRGGLVKEDRVVRTWRYPHSASLFNSLP